MCSDCYRANHELSNRYTTACNNQPMAARKYELKRRAERAEQTRRRIVEAAIELHGTIGPARTTVTAVASCAGVQRHTYYRHFPDQRSLMLACSGLYGERNPWPDPDEWRRIEGSRRRLTHGLAELFDFYERNERMLANITRDAEVDPLTREISTLRRRPAIERMRDVLAEPFGARRERRRRLIAAIELALDFRTWQRLVRVGALRRSEAVDVLVRAIAGQ
jgi:AcrR family transcriptional regulator